MTFEGKRQPEGSELDHRFRGKDRDYMHGRLVRLQEFLASEIGSLGTIPESPIASFAGEAFIPVMVLVSGDRWRCWDEKPPRTDRALAWPYQ